VSLQSSQLRVKGVKTGDPLGDLGTSCVDHARQLGGRVAAVP